MDQVFWTINPTMRTAPPIISGADLPDCAYCGGTGTKTVAQHIRWGRKGQPDEVLEERLIPADVPPMRYYDYLAGHPVEGDEYRRLYLYWTVGSGPCDCQQPLIARRRMQRVLGQPGMPEEDFNFVDFEAYPHCRRALQYARWFVDHDSILDERGIERTGLLLYGPTGTFKTSLGKVVFRTRVQAGQAGVWIKCINLIERIKQTYQEGYEGSSKESICEVLMFTPFLMLDELGSLTQRGLYFEDFIQMLYRVADHRLAKRLPTLVTTNLLEKQLIDQFGNPFVSRLAGLCHGILMVASDYRRNPDETDRDADR